MYKGKEKLFSYMYIMERFVPHAVLSILGTAYSYWRDATQTTVIEVVL